MISRFFLIFIFLSGLLSPNAWSRGHATPCPPNDTQCISSRAYTDLIFIIIGILGGASAFFLGSNSTINRNKIEPKAAKTNVVLNILAENDKNMQPEILLKTVNEIFIKLQECWFTDDYSPMQTLLTPSLYKDHETIITHIRWRHEYYKMPRLQIDHIDLIDVTYSHQIKEFTALITASPSNFYVNYLNPKYSRGQVAPNLFQEFWVFQWFMGGWRLKTIYQASKTVILRRDNFVEKHYL